MAVDGQQGVVKKCREWRGARHTQEQPCNKQGNRQPQRRVCTYDASVHAASHHLPPHLTAAHLLCGAALLVLRALRTLALHVLHIHLVILQQISKQGTRALRLSVSS